MNPTAAEIASGAGQGIGGGIAIFALLRFIRWATEFFCKRMDVRATRLDAREKALEAKFNDRLRHVEQELERYREATMLLVNALAERDPQNGALVEVARILKRAVPVGAPDSGLDELLQRAGDAVDRVRKGGSANAA